MVLMFLTGAASPGPLVTQKQVAELQKQVDQKKAELDAIDQKRDEIERSAQDPAAPAQELTQNLEDARSALALLEAVRQGMLQQQNQSYIDRRAQQNELRLDAQVQSAQFHDQVARAQAALTELKRKLQEQ
jgi:hypothetical protein